MLKYILENGCPISSLEPLGLGEIANHAARPNGMPILQWLAGEQGVVLADTRALAEAAGQGHFDVMDWLMLFGGE